MTLPICSRGMSTAPILIARARWATKNGSSLSASRSPAASTHHQIACSPNAHDAIVARWRRGLSWPLKAANAAPHSSGSWLCWIRKRGMRSE